MKKTFPGGNGIRFMPVDGLRAIEERAKGGDGAKRFEVAFSSEKEVTRMGWFGNWREVLGHDAGEVQMGRFQSGRANMLEEHRGAPIGVIETASIDKDKMGRAVVRTSRTQRGKDAALDMEDDTRTNISVGYIPKRAKLIEENEELGDLWRITLWEPLELSLVGVPADDDVGKDRSVRGHGYPPVETEGSEAEPVRGQNVAEKIVVESGAREARAVEVETIRALCEMNRLPRHYADGLVEADLSVEQARKVVLNQIETRGHHAQPSAESLDVMYRGGRVAGMSRRDANRYSIPRAIMLAAGLRDSSLNVPFNGLEAEVHRELERTLPAELGPRHGGILVPMDMRTPEESWSQRTLQTNIAGKGAELIASGTGEFIELLRALAAVVMLGARTITGLTGPLGFPKQTNAATAVWVGENVADVADSDLGLGIVLMAQKTLQASTGYTRQMLVQGSPEIDSIVRNDIVNIHARAIDKAAIHGLGAAGQPVGIYAAPDVNAIAMGGAVAFGELIDMVTEVGKDNAASGRLGFLTTVALAGKLKQTLVAASAGSDMIWTGSFEDGEIAGFRAAASTQVSSTMLGSAETGGSEHGVIFGNWAEVIIGLFSTLELVVDPFTKKKKGVIEVASFQMADLILRHGESFCKATGATLA